MQEYEALYKKHYALVFKFIMRMTQYEKPLAEDLTQETFLQVFLSLHRFRGRSSVETWIIGIAKNVVFSYFSKNKHRPALAHQHLTGALKDEACSIDSFLESKETIEAIFRIIAAFPPKTSDVMVLRLAGELPFSQIAQQLGISSNSARVLFCRGKEKLLQQLKEVYGHEI